MGVAAAGGGESAAGADGMPPGATLLEWSPCPRGASATGASDASGDPKRRGGGRHTASAPAVRVLVTPPP